MARDWVVFVIDPAELRRALTPRESADARLADAYHRYTRRRSAQDAWESELQERIAAAVTKGGVDRTVYLDVGGVYRAVPSRVAAWARQYPRP